MCVSYTTIAKQQQHTRSKNWPRWLLLFTCLLVPPESLNKNSPGRQEQFPFGTHCTCTALAWLGYKPYLRWWASWGFFSKKEWRRIKKLKKMKVKNDEDEDERIDNNENAFWIDCIWKCIAIMQWNKDKRFIYKHKKQQQ